MVVGTIGEPTKPGRSKKAVPGFPGFHRATYFAPMSLFAAPSGREVDILSLLNPDGEFDHGQLRYLKDLSRRISEGECAITRLDPEEEQGRIAGGRIHVEASLVLGAVEAASGRMLGKSGYALQRQTRSLRRYAEAAGLWQDEDRIADAAREWLPRGQEAGVYVDQDGTTVTKVIRFNRFSTTPLEFLDNRITLHNYLFPDTRYGLTGITEAYNDLAFVVKQPFVQGSELAAEAMPLLSEGHVEAAAKVQQAMHERIRQYLWESFGMKPAPGNITTYYNELYIIKDLHGHNVLQAEGGSFHIIDAAPSLNTPATGGVRLYQPFKVWEQA